MGKKTFEMVARVLGKVRDARMREALAEDFASELAKENPRFDREKFLQACGVGEESPHA